MAKVTAIVTSASMMITGGLFALYNFWALDGVKEDHHRAEMEGGWGQWEDHMGLVDEKHGVV